MRKCALQPLLWIQSISVRVPLVLTHLHISRAHSILLFAAVMFGIFFPSADIDLLAMAVRRGVGPFSGREQC